MSYPLKSLNLSNFTFNRTHKLILNQLVSSGQENTTFLSRYSFKFNLRAQFAILYHVLVTYLYNIPY